MTYSIPKTGKPKCIPQPFLFAWYEDRGYFEPLHNIRFNDLELFEADHYEIGDKKYALFHNLLEKDILVKRAKDNFIEIL